MDLQKVCASKACRNISVAKRAIHFWEKCLAAGKMSDLVDYMAVQDDMSAQLGLHTWSEIYPGLSLTKGVT